MVNDRTIQEKGNSHVENGLGGIAAYSPFVDAIRVRNALSSVSNGTAPSNRVTVAPVAMLPQILPGSSIERTTGASPTLVKRGQKKKKDVGALTTRPLTVPTGSLNPTVKNRFKHTKPGSHVVGVESKQKSALQVLSDSYSDSEGPPAKQIRTETGAVAITPMGVISTTPQQQQQQQPMLRHNYTIGPGAVTQSSLSSISAPGTPVSAHVKPIISLCPSCRSKQTMHVSNGLYKCGNCNRNYLPIKGVPAGGITTTATALLPATFYATPQAVTAHRVTLKKAPSSAPAKTRSKKPAETIDLISSDEDEEQEEAECDAAATKEGVDGSSAPENSDSTTVSAAPIPNSTPTKPANTTSNNTALANVASGRLTDRMKLKGGEAGAATANNKNSVVNPTIPPSPSPSPVTNEYVFHCNKVMFGELYGQSVAPTKVADNRMYLSLECLIIRENVQASEKYTLSVGSNDVEQMFVYFGRTPSFVAIETAKKFASVACKRIGKEVLCPGSEDPKKRYILLALNSAFKNDSEADSERRNLITSVSSWAQIRVLSHNEALQLVAQAQLDVNQKEICYGKTVKALGPVETLLIYPPSLKSGGIPITTLDVACLDEGTYLNDIIIDFYLKYICESVMTKEQCKRTYIFNSYFYKRLTQKASSRTDPALIHAQVKKWTRGVDIFQKDFVIIPINEHCHWYLAIICFHGQPLANLDLNEKEEEEEEEENSNEDFVMKEMKDTSTSTPGEEEEAEIKRKSMEEKEYKLDPVISSTPPHKQEETGVSQPPQASALDSSLEDSVFAANTTKGCQPQMDNDGSDTHPKPEQQPQSDTETPVLPPIKTPVKELPKQANELDELYRPCILIFDSLVGSGHSRVFTNLRNYLTQEWLSRKPTDEPRVFDKDSMKGCYPKIPRQNNDCDCGVFLLQYAEYFFSKPIRNFRMPVHLESWFTVDSVTKKRDGIKELIAKLVEENKTLNCNKPPAPKTEKLKSKKKV